MAESFPNGQKTLWEKEKLLVMNNFSFSHSVFKRLVLQTCKNQGLCGKVLSLYTIPTFSTPKERVFSSPEHKVLRVSYCDHSPSVICPSICRPLTFPCLHSSIYKYQPISTKLGQNIYDYKISDEFYYGSNQTRTSGVICPCYILLYFTLFTVEHLQISTNQRQTWSKYI